MAITDFPVWHYHRTKGGKIFYSQAELEAAGEGWEDSPAKFEKPGVVTTEQAHGQPSKPSGDEQKAPEDEKKDQPTAQEIRMMNKQQLYDLAKSLNPAAVPAFEECTKYSLKAIIFAANPDGGATVGGAQNENPVV